MLICCSCPNALNPSKAQRAIPYLKEWTSIYLKHARQRLQKKIKGYEVSIEDVYTMQELCAYEVHVFLFVWESYVS